MGKFSGKKSSRRKSSERKSVKNVKKVKKMVEVEVDEVVEDNTAIEEAIAYCSEMKDVYKNFDYFVLKDKEGYDKLEVQSRFNKRVPFIIRFARYRMLVKSFFPNTKVDAKKQEEILGFGYDGRDCGNAGGGNTTIWYKKVYRPDLEPDVVSFKLWLDYLCDETKTKPKLTINNINHF